MTEEQKYYLLALSDVEKVGSVISKTLISYCGGPKEVFETPKKKLLQIPGIGEATIENIKAYDDWKKIEKELIFTQKNEIDILDYSDQDFPKRLKYFDSCPLMIFKKGEIELNPLRTVGIVGTRNATEYGKMQCEKIVEGLQSFGVTTISGLAYGIDTICHRKSVELGIPTIGILGHGLDRIYPHSNKDLARKMQQNGAIITTFFTNTLPNRENFPARNKVVAGYCDVVVVVESGSKGGSIITANFANDYNKDVFAVPGRLGDELSEGCNNLIKQHKAHLIQSAEDIAYIMRWEEQKEDKSIQTSLFVELSDEELSIIDTIRNIENIEIDELLFHSKMPSSQLATILLQLEFKGIVKSLPGKKYVLY
ncbi:MAG TPA: DNA-processing protein DprA [Saprospiraceae bacterium]|nr:DNA-protecting protein DprA [Lewinellaceae bacterium]HPK09437.1 DNA-processing protein DprA [Saprospiraceae bacterium]HPQ20306.1 DNA-processing protein DprA [Saprospiraceae bacterium]HRX28299.1 DNA-processing protein DprA [Saprospiraceae bacterium]